MSECGAGDSASESGVWENRVRGRGDDHADVLRFMVVGCDFVCFSLCFDFRVERFLGHGDDSVRGSWLDSFVAGEFVDGRKWGGTPLEGYLLDAFSRSIDSWSVRPTLFHAAVWSSAADFTWIGDLDSTRLVTAILVPAAAPRRIDSIIVFMLIVHGTSLLRFPDLPADGRRRQRFFTIWIILTHSGDFGNHQENRINSETRHPHIVGAGV
ncbi:hypothetical protein [Bifidobacterium dentium]|uniref:hypothetical protein n=1 Tax=Bifidobacterium dentium TaxID=1689 RepID=UPI001F510E01|nr:hypothetical protein [Bifidobacterium dentium]